MKSSVYAASGLLAALVWVVALLVDGHPFSPTSVFLIGLGMLTTATVATVGMIVAGGRWARRLGLIGLVLTVVLALTRSIDLAWIVGVAATTASVMALLSPAVTSVIRRLPAASGPPPRAVLPPLILLVTPALLGFSAGSAPSWSLLVVGITAPVAAFFYSRVLPGGLLTIRVIWPLLVLAMSPFLGPTAGPLAALIALVVATVAWDRSVKTSYHPPQEPGTTVPIPPELAPKEIRDAAGIDEKGRRV